MIPPTWSFFPSAFTVDGTTLYLPIPHPQNIPNPLWILRLFLNTSLQILPRLELAKRFHSPPSPAPPVLDTDTFPVQPWVSPAQRSPFAVSACPLTPAWLAKQPVSSPITQREHLNGRHRASVYPVGLLTHAISVNTSYRSPVYANCFFPSLLLLPPPPLFFLLAWCIHSQTADT